MGTGIRGKTSGVEKQDIGIPGERGPCMSLWPVPDRPSQPFHSILCGMLLFRYFPKFRGRSSSWHLLVPCALAALALDGVTDALRDNFKSSPPTALRLESASWVVQSRYSHPLHLIGAEYPDSRKAVMPLSKCSHRVAAGSF